MLVFALLAPAFISGILMFLAPCTLPMIPGYLTFISGVSNKEVEDTDTQSFAQSKIRKNSIFFLIGFSLVFILLGTLLGFFSSFFEPIRSVLLRVSGLVVIFFSLYILKIIPQSLFSRTFKFKIPSWFHVGNPKSSFLLGIIFALGWSPCIGPILGTVLALAGTLSTALQGTILLFTFSLGFAIPFIISAFLYHRSQEFFNTHISLFKVFSIIGGVLMLIIGILLILNEWSLFQEWGFKIFNFVEYEKIQNFL